MLSIYLAKRNTYMYQNLILYKITFLYFVGKHLIKIKYDLLNFLLQHSVQIIVSIIGILGKTLKVVYMMKLA